jgi:uncharacterized protein (DUF1330 family)
MGLDITEEALGAFLEGDEGPVVLVNLIRLKEGGEEAYRLYGEAVGPLLEKHGAELIYAGAAKGVLIGEERWDFAAVTRYPSRAALAELVRDPEFVASAPLRHSALDDGMLYAFA